MLNHILTNSIFPLLAGYLIIDRCRVYSYIRHQASGYNLLFRSLIYGLILFATSYLIVAAIDGITPFDARELDSVLQFENLTSTIIMFVLAGIVILIDLSQSDDLINIFVRDSIDSRGLFDLCNILK